MERPSRLEERTLPRVPAPDKGPSSSDKLSSFAISSADGRPKQRGMMAVALSVDV